MTFSDSGQLSSLSLVSAKNRKIALIVFTGVLFNIRRKMSSLLVTISAPGIIISHCSFWHPQLCSGVISVLANKVSLLYLKHWVGISWEYSTNLAGVYLNYPSQNCHLRHNNKNALLTGVDKGSIGMEILKVLLSGGAHIIITTSWYNCSTIKYYQSIYQTVGIRGSAVTVVPFN